jgi:hypothetical protein
MKTLKTLLSLTLIVATVATVRAHLDGSPPGHTGAPGEGTCADAGCHDAYPINDSGYVAVFFSESTPDTVRLDVEVLKIVPCARFGFQVTIRDATGASIGQFILSDITRTQIVTDSLGEAYVTHTEDGVAPTGDRSALWTVYWQYPPGGWQPIEIYATGCAADGDGAPVGDHVFRQFGSCPIQMAGDVNVDSKITTGDVVYLVNHVFKGGPDPLPCVANGDVNCNGSVTSSDIIYLLGYVFKGGSHPCDICLDPNAMACI